MICSRRPHGQRVAKPPQINPSRNIVLSMRFIYLLQIFNLLLLINFRIRGRRPSNLSVRTCQHRNPIRRTNTYRQLLFARHCYTKNWLRHAQRSTESAESIGATTFDASESLTGGTSPILKTLSDIPKFAAVYLTQVRRFAVPPMIWCGTWTQIMGERSHREPIVRSKPIPI